MIPLPPPGPPPDDYSPSLTPALNADLSRMRSLSAEKDVEREARAKAEADAIAQEAEHRAAEQRLRELDASIIETMRQNQHNVLEAVAQTKGGPDWKKSGKVGQSDAFVRNDSGTGGIIGVMGRGRVVASRDEIIHALREVDPAKKVVERQTVEEMGMIQGEVEECSNEADGVEGVPRHVGLAWVGLACPIITDRDFCVAQLASPVPSDLPAEHKEWVVGNVSVEHPAVDIRKKYVRGELMLSGWHIKPLPDKVPCCTLACVEPFDPQCVLLNTGWEKELWGDILQPNKAEWLGEQGYW